MKHGLAELAGTEERRLFDKMQALLDNSQFTPDELCRKYLRGRFREVDGFASRRIAARLVADESGGTAPVHYFVTLPG